MLDQIGENKEAVAVSFDTAQSLFDYLRPLLDEEPEYDENLIDYGLTSIDVMKLVSNLREGGLVVKFDELARSLSIDGIWKCICAAKGA